MSKKYEKLSVDIIDKLGGKENIADVYHCQTRLRFKLVDETKVDEDSLKGLDGVATYLFNAGVHQVVIGTDVKAVFEEIEKNININGNTVVEQEKKGIFTTIIEFIAGTFQPIIPALSGAGMVKAVLALLVVFGVVSTDSQTYYLLNLFADGVFYFLPMLLAFTVAQKLRSNPILAVSVAAMMMHPNWTALVTAGEPVKFFEILPFNLSTYAGSVIPIILIVCVQSYVEKFFNKVIPKSVELVFVPMLTFLVMGTLAFSILGPIGSILGGYLASIFTFLSVNVSWLPAVIIGGFLPVMVMFGLHNAVAPLGVMQMAELGYDSIFGPGCVCSNMAQATAAAVVAFRTKDKKLKQLAVSGSITAYMGITEPVLYGVNLPKKYPLVAAMIGGGTGGLYAGLTGVHRFATGSSGLPTILLYIGDNSMVIFGNIIIALLISAVVSGVLTYILSFKFEKELDIPDMKEVILENELLINPIPGKVIPLSEVNDGAFASGALGKGFAIEPTEGKVVAPFNGKVVAIFPTKHAIGLVSDKGVEILIHVGLNTVELNGQYFDALIEADQEVEKGQVILNFDLEKIKEAGYDTHVPVVVTNTMQYETIELVEEDQLSEGTPVLTVSV